MLKLVCRTLEGPRPLPHCACFSSIKEDKDQHHLHLTTEPSSNIPVETPSWTPENSSLKWRTPWHQKEASYYSGLRSFANEKSHTNVIKWLQTPINLTPSGIKDWWAKRKEYREIMLQSYLPERNHTLGNELAAAHFIVHRGGAVKFHGRNDWVRADEYKNHVLPRNFEADKILEAIDCANVNLYYEGLATLKGLKQMEWLSFHGVQNLDDWFLDRISNLFSHSLIYLDIRNCPNYTERGLGALYKLDKLKILCISDILMTRSFEMTCLLLQEANPELDIRVAD